MATERSIIQSFQDFLPYGLTGRRKIRLNAVEVTRDNVLDVYQKARAIHDMNVREISYLYSVYRGRQDILDKIKFEREYINEKIVVNRANEIVTFKTAYLLSEPVQYTSTTGDEQTSNSVSQLNKMMKMVNKDAKDKEIVDWMHIAGVSERLTLEEKDPEKSGAPFCVYTVDPRNAFAVYTSDYRCKKICGVILGRDEEDKEIATVYTDKWCCKIRKGQIVEESVNAIGEIPLVEYENNFARIGAFEVVLTILDHINQLESSAVDAVVDFVNGFDVFSNCEIANGDYKNLSLGGRALKVKTVVQGMEAKVYRISSELNQQGVQTRIDDLTDAYLEICGMPNRNGGSSTSDTGTAVLFRDGWSAADSRAKDTETMFKKAEREFDRIVLRICEISQRGKYDLKMSLSDFEPKFPRTNLSNLQTKVQVLCEMLNNEKIDPRYAFEKCGLFDDAEDACRISLAYYNSRQEEQEAKLQEELNNARDYAKSGAAPKQESVSSSEESMVDET